MNRKNEVGKEQIKVTTMAGNSLDDKILLARMDPELVADQIGEFIIEEVLRSNATGCVIGLSGGIDSSTTAALAKRAFDKYNKTHKDKPLELVGYMLPTNTNHPSDTKDGIRVAELLGLRYEVHSIQPLVEPYSITNPETVNSKYHKGNLMAEIRATVLHRKGATENKSVLGTGNKDEDFGVGYYTLFGDGAVHMSPIGPLPKRLVREMGKYLGLPEDIVHRVPTAGLEHGQTDFKDLGYSYETVELVIEGIDQGFSWEQLPKHRQVIRYGQKDMEDYEMIHGKSKFSNMEDLVYDIRRRNIIGRKKSEILDPPQPRVTLEYE
jgi:NAD+ synthase